jgi:hypothetical protein
MNGLVRIALTDNQLSIVTRHAEPLPASDRSRYLHRVASLLHDQEIGGGAVARACARAQGEIFKAPNLHGINGEARPLGKLVQRRSPSAA